jgi:hypothetical protein
MCNFELHNLELFSLQLPDDLFEPGQSRKGKAAAAAAGAGKKRKRPSNEDEGGPKQ